jgi:hypothetical protein
MLSIEGDRGGAEAASSGRFDVLAAPLALRRGSMESETRSLKYAIGENSLVTVPDVGGGGEAESWTPDARGDDTILMPELAADLRGEVLDFASLSAETAAFRAILADVLRLGLSTWSVVLPFLVLLALEFRVVPFPGVESPGSLGLTFAFGA